MQLQGFQPLTLKGEFVIRHIRDGKVLSEETIDNTVTNTGIAKVAGLIEQVTSVGFKWLALDASSTAAAAANTALASEITSPSLKRVAATCTRVTTTITNDTAQALHTFASTATQSVYGAGLFDTATSGGVMTSRATFAVKNLVNGDTLAITHKLKVA